MTSPDHRARGVAMPALALCGLLSAGAAHANVLVVDPFAMAAGEPRAGLAELEVAVLGGEDFDVRDIVRQSLRIGVAAGPSPGGAARLLEVRRRDVDDDGHRDLLARIDLPDALDDLPEGLANEVFAEFTLRDRGPGRDRTARFRQVRLGAPLEDTAALGDAASACKVVAIGIEWPVRCTWTSGAGVTPLDLASLVGDLNDGLLSGSGTQIPADAEVAIEATGGSGGIQGYNDTPSCQGATYIATGVPGPGGYAVTVQTLSSLSELWIYPGSNGATAVDRFAAGSSSLVAEKDVTTVTMPLDPAGQGILVIGGGGGSGGDWDDCGCNDGHDGGDGGVAHLSTSGDASAAGGSAGQSAVDGGGGNVDGGGAGGNGANDADALAGQPGIGGFGGPQGGAVAGWDGVPFWAPGQGGPSTSAAGTGQCEGISANRGAGGGGFGGGGGGGGAPGQHVGSGGGGGSWAKQAVVSNPALVQGKASSAMVAVTFATEEGS